MLEPPVKPKKKKGHSYESRPSHEAARPRELGSVLVEVAETWLEGASYLLLAP